MARPLSRGRAFGLAVILFTAAAVGACGGEATGASPSATAIPTASPTPDLAASFAAKLGAGIGRARCEITGTMQMGPVTATITGTYVTAIGDSITHLTITTSDGSAFKEGFATIGGESYELADAGYWLLSDPEAGASPEPQGPGGTFEKAFSGATAYRVTGTDTAQGVTIYTLEPTSPVPLDAEAFGVAAPDVSDFEGSLTFLAKADGTPAGFDVTASWQKGSGADAAAVIMTMRWLIKETGASVSVALPEAAWKTHTSTELGYSMVHLANWDVSFSPETPDYYASDLYLGPTDGEIDVYRITDAPKGSQPNAVFRDILSWLQDQATDTPEVLQDLQLADGSRVRIFGAHVANPDATYAQVAVVVSNTEIWEIDWYSQPGTEEADKLAFGRSVTSFTRTE